MSVVHSVKIDFLAVSKTKGFFIATELERSPVPSPGSIGEGKGMGRKRRIGQRERMSWIVYVLSDV